MQLKQLRKRRGLTQKDLADMIGMDPSTIQRAEIMHHSVKLATYIACAKVLDVQLSDIFSDPNRQELHPELMDAVRRIDPDQHPNILAFLRAAELLRPDPKKT